MKLSSDLLDQAEHLATKERKKPKQASLRRSISATYYAMFHFLIDAAVKEAPMPSRNGLRRSFGHKGLKDISKSFAAGQPDIPEPLKSTKAPAVHDYLRQFARAFISLQDARHEADYNLPRRFARTEALDHLATARDAISAWKRLQHQDPDQARLYLFCLLFGATSRR
jgi:hypothetical protein